MERQYFFAAVTFVGATKRDSGRASGGRRGRATRTLTDLAGLTLLATTVLAVGCAPRAESTAPRAPSGAAAGEPSGAEPPAAGPSAPRPAGEPDQVGLASWYGKAFAGKPTASGERFDPTLFTAAHKKLRFGTWVEVRRIDTGRAVRVRINDRGPNGRAAHRIIDLSQRAAEELDILRAGVVRVELRVVGGP